MSETFQCPKELKILQEPDTMVVLVTSQTAEEVEVAPVVEEALGTEPEVIEHGKLEEEEAE